jgi:hypothetical protein
MAFGAWAFGKRAGFYAGLCMATCIGLFLFTRILIPDVMLTFTVALGMWAFLRALDEEEPHPRFWAFVLAANLGLGLLLKSLIGMLFPLAAGVHLSLDHSPAFFCRDLAKAASLQRIADHPAYRCALAHSGNAAQSSLLRVYASQRAGTISRLSLVLLSSMSNCFAF